MRSKTMKKMFLLTVPLVSGERLCQRTISQLVKEENYLVEEAIDLLLNQNEDYAIVDQNVFEHITTVLADDKDEAYDIYLQKHLKKNRNIPYFFKEQLIFTELA